MKLRTLVVVVVLLAVLSVAAYLSNRPAPAPATDPRVGQPVLGQDAVNAASTIVISDQGKTVALARAADGSWRVPSYHDLPADFSKIAQLMRDLNEAKVDRFVTDNPGRMDHLEFKDSYILLNDSAGKTLWKLTLGKAPDSGEGRFIRFGEEPKAFFSGMHTWLDTDPKGWANAQLVDLKADEVAKVEVSFDGGAVVALSRAKKDAPWSASPTPAGKQVAADRVAALLTTLTSLRFSDTVDPTDPLAADAAPHLRPITLTTFDGKTLTVALGRKPEQKKLKAPVADTGAPARLAGGKPDEKPVTPEFDTVPAGPVFAVVSSSDARAPVNASMKERAFEVDEYVFTGLPQKADDLFEAQKAKL